MSSGEQPDQTHPKTRGDNDDERDEDRDQRAAEDDDAEDVRAAIEEIAEDTAQSQLGEQEESVSSEQAQSETDSEGALPDFEEFENDGEDDSNVDLGGNDESESTSGGGGGGEAVAADAGFDRESPDEASPPSEPNELGTTDPESVQEEFGLDFSDTNERTADHSGLDYSIPSRDQRDKIQSAIESRHGEEAWSTIYDCVSEWKGSSGGENPARLESIAREALDVDADLRLSDGMDADDIPDPTDNEVAAFRDLSRITQAFVREHHTNENGLVEVHRGIPRGRREATAHLTEQLLSNPDRDAYTLSTSVLSNHTPATGTANFFEDTFSVSYQTDPSNIAMMPSMLRDGIQEAEMHIAGGGAVLEPESVGSAVADRSFSDLSDAIQNPGDAAEGTHETMKRAVRSIKKSQADISENAAKGLIRYGHKAGSETSSPVNVTIRGLFRESSHLPSEYSELYSSYDPETDTFDT